MGSRAALYLHIPYCRSKCAYCDFFSLPLNTAAAGTIPDSFVDALLAEISRRAVDFGIEAWTSLYVGGGTPSLLSEAQLARLLAGAAKVRPFVPGAEVTVEANPESLTESWLDAAAASGVNRLSAGIQSLAETELAAVGRCCGKKEALAALTLLQRAWPGRFSADLIAGLPSQSLKSLTDGLKELLAFAPDHISLYTLTLEESTPLYRAVQNGSVPFSADTADELWLAGRDLLEKNGYRQYEVSNFAKPGFESVHNASYWQCLPYVGCGPAACGTIESIRYTNTRNIDLWTRLCLEGNVAEAQETEELSRPTRIFEYLFMGLRTRRGLDAAAFEKRFGTPLEPFLGDVFSRWEKRGQAVVRHEEGGDFYALTADGLLFLNTFCAELPNFK